MTISTCTEQKVVKPCKLQDIYYQVDPYIGCEHHCNYCYALKYANTNWKKELILHENIVNHLKKELEEIPPQTIHIGHETDPYQPCEKNLIQTRKVLDILLEKKFSANILTKSDLVLRDKYILRNMGNASVSISVAFTDNNIRELFEYKTIDTERRINALKELKQLGIQTNAIISPVIPYVTDVLELICMLESYADTIGIYGLNMTSQSEICWQNVKTILNDHFPNTKDIIEEAIFNKNHNYWYDLRNDLEIIKEERSLNLQIHI